MVNSRAMLGWAARARQAPLRPEGRRDAEL